MFVLGALGLPKRNGKLKDLSRFDAAFFGVHPKQASYMDPQLRILLTLTYEAIIDAGSYSYRPFVQANESFYISYKEQHFATCPIESH